MKRIVVTLLTIVFIALLSFANSSIDAISALANEADTQAVDSAGEISGEEIPDGEEEPLVNTALEPEADADLAYEQQDAEVLASSQDENPEEQSYWIDDPCYSQLIGEYETLAAAADGVTVIAGATLTVTSSGAGLQSVIRVPGLAQVLSNGVFAPDYADGSGMLLTEREGFPQVGTSSDRSVLRLIESRESEAVYEASFFFGSSRYPDAPFTAFRTYVVLGNPGGGQDEEVSPQEIAVASEDSAEAAEVLLVEEIDEGKEEVAEAGLEIMALSEELDLVSLEDEDPIATALAEGLTPLSGDIEVMASADDFVVGGHYYGTITSAGNWNGSYGAAEFDVWFTFAGMSMYSRMSCMNPELFGPIPSHVHNYVGWQIVIIITGIDRDSGTVSYFTYVNAPVPGVSQNLRGPGSSFPVTVQRDIALVKTSANPALTNNNPNYDLAGAHYGLYASDSDARLDLNRIHVFATDSAGNSNVAYSVPEGVYFVRELTAPRGYQLDPNIYTVVHNSILTTVTMTDVPYGDITLIKTSTLPHITNGNPSFDLAGAQYGLYRSRADAGNDTISIDTFTDDSAGNSNRAYSLPPGDYFVKELTAPRGYQLDSNIYPVVHNSALTTATMSDVPYGDIVLTKSSASPSITDGNACYDLAGAEYGLYKSWADAENDTNRVHTFVTDSAGNSNRATSLVVGDYYVKEVVAPKGYDLDTTIYSVAHNSTLTIVATTDAPLSDPVTMLVRKLDARTGEAWGQDDPAGLLLADGEFTVRYWDGYYGTVEDAEASGAPTRTWVFRTGNNGIAQFNSNYYLSGGALYNNQYGNAVIPLGSIAIQETKAPLGYLLPNPNPVSFQVIQETGNPLDPVTRLNAATFYDDDRPVIAHKVDSDTNEPVPDTEFTLYKESAPGAGDWQAIASHVTDDYGKCVFSPIAPGSYKLAETRPNPAYADAEESGDGAHYFTITESSTDEVQVFKNDLIQVAIDVYKNTIPLTNTALDGTKDSVGNNVGYEEYIYNFGAKSNSNVRVDEFVITDSLEYVASQGYRMTSIWTGTTPPGMDHDGLMAVLYRTNKTDPDLPVVFSYDYMAANPYNPNNPDNKMSTSNEPGWVIWKEQLSTTEATRLDVADLGLDDDEYIIGIRVVYGGVDKGFYTGKGFGEGEASGIAPTRAPLFPDFELRDWSYSVVATDALLTVDEMGNETVMKGSIQADLFRNWGSDAPVLTDVAQDLVETRVIETFTYDKQNLGVSGGGFFASFVRGLPGTGDNTRILIALLVVLAGAGLGCIALATNRRKDREKDLSWMKYTLIS